MPKRTNAFQELVAIIHSRLGSGWFVTESMFLRDGITGEPREVDVVAKATAAGYDLHISVECRDHGRPADVTWIEGMAKKHESLATSKLALWSRSGFTKAAVAKAAALKIETVSQATATDADWATLARSLIGGHVQLVIPKFSPFIDVETPGNEPVRLKEVATSLIYDAHGNAIQSLPSILEFIANSAEFGTMLLDHAPTGSGDFYVEVRPPVPWFAETPDGYRASILRVGVGVSTFVEKLALDTASATVDGKVATLASANAASGRFKIYVEEARDGSKLLKTTVMRKT